AAPVEVALQRQVLTAGQLAVDARLLRDDADPATHVGRLPVDVEAGHPRGPGVGPRPRGQDLDGGRLAGAVRNQQTEDGARRDGEAQPVECADVLAVRLDQPGGLDRVPLDRHYVSPQPPGR